MFCLTRAVYVDVSLRSLPSDRGSRRKSYALPRMLLSPDWPPAKLRLFGRGSRGGRRHLNRAQAATRAQSFPPSPIDVSVVNTSFPGG